MATVARAGARVTARTPSPPHPCHWAVRHQCSPPGRGCRRSSGPCLRGARGSPTPPSVAACRPGRTRRSWARRPTPSWTATPALSSARRPARRRVRCRASNDPRAPCRWPAPSRHRPRYSGYPRCLCGCFRRRCRGAVRPRAEVLRLGHERPWSGRPFSGWLGPVRRLQRIRSVQPAQPAVPLRAEVRRLPLLPEVRRRRLLPEVRRRPLLPEVRRRPLLPEVRRRPLLPEVPRATLVRVHPPSARAARAETRSRFSGSPRWAPRLSPPRHALFPPDRAPPP
ncbi:hypothetical protein M2283_006574 [Streptomyces pseudovenezuelae]|uniref:Uncharacterized protein n=1 Tax=Streptomyces pseudovenezuelae TaxID=67350 RepID=A0ABT6LSD6_9ACTN|nr:hypothetical protein [Streptomyces pseudovenezuelae]